MTEGAEAPLGSFVPAGQVLLDELQQLVRDGFFRNAVVKLVQALLKPNVEGFGRALVGSDGAPGRRRRVVGAATVVTSGWLEPIVIDGVPVEKGEQASS